MCICKTNKEQSSENGKSGGDDLSEIGICLRFRNLTKKGAWQ